MKKVIKCIAVLTCVILFISCTKEYSAQRIIPKLEWEFTAETKDFSGSFYDVYDTTVTGVGYLLVIVGTTPTTDSVLVAQVHFPGSSIVPGTYSTSSVGNGFYYSDIRDTANPILIYSAESRSVGAATQLVITSYDPITGIVTGTFSGTALNASNLPVSITEGKFKAKVR
jgi:hypothetical protein